MINIAKNKNALNIFLQIINAHGAFLKERELIKNNKEKLPTEEEKQDLISTEKYYKKLKHQFIERFPELESEMKQELEIYLTNLENKKRQRYSLINKITSLSDRFISFYQYTFLLNYGVKIAYSNFAKQIKSKCNNKLVKNIEDKYYKMADGYILNHKKENSLNVKLDFHSINELAHFLNVFLSNVSKEDLENTEQYIDGLEKNKEKNDIVYQIINEQYQRFSKLLNDYLELKTELDNL